MPTNLQADALEYVPIAGGLELAVPASIDRLTTYVLKEQGDWFEDEIAFCRRLVRPGDGVMDVGANYGVYALTAAKLVGPTGRVWAFEPAREPADCLARSIERNSQENLTLVRAALSDREGSATLFTSAASELNSLGKVEGLHAASEEVMLLTLDAVARDLDIEEISFLKLDAEGEERRILDASWQFFAKSSPLIMFEVRHGDQVNVGLVEALRGLGFLIFRLIPGLSILVPVAPEDELEPFQLNLFAASPERAQVLQRRGLLATEVPAFTVEDDPWAGLAWIVDRPYGQRLASRWSERAAPSETVQRALAEWARAHDETRPPAERFARLTNALEGLAAAIDESPNLPRLLSSARVSFELGLRATGLRALEVALHLCVSGWPLALDEPFLAPDPRYDTIDPGDRMDAWVTASAIEAREKKRAFSSYFTGTSALSDLEALTRLGFLTGPMARRLDLIRQRLRATGH